MGSIVTLPGKDIAPKTLLAQVMDNNPSAVIIVARHGDIWKASWSAMRTDDVTFALKVLELKVNDVVAGKDIAYE